MAIRIHAVNSNFEREPLTQSFGFKGSSVTELWQTVALLQSTSGRSGVGLGSQSVLWADSGVFAAHSESGGNALMYLLTERALQMAKDTSFETPIDLIDELLDELYAYGKEITCNPELQKTFVLNALVPLDLAAWLLYAREHEIDDFDEMIPEAYRPGLSYCHERVAAVPAFGYDTPLDKIKEAIDHGYYILKIKIGHPGTQEEMLEKDKQRLSAIHEAVGSRRTESGEILYYLDANARYASVETLRQLLEHADRIDALDQVIILEEPFDAHVEQHVDDLPVRVAADESAHSVDDALRVIQQGYGAIALKPVAKTLSVTLEIAKVAHEHDVPCFCADLTVNPILVDWNKNVAARLYPFPGFDTGLMETNGHQHYECWSQMERHHSQAGAAWTKTRQGVFELGKDFYDQSGGIFGDAEHYRRLVQV